MATIAWVVLKHHRKADGTYSPKIRVTHNRTTSYMPTNIHTELVRFKRGAKSGAVTDTSIEEYLNDQVSSIRKILNLNQEAVAFYDTAKELVDYINRQISKRDIEIDFVEFAREYISSIRNGGTKRTYGTRINSLCHYLKAATGSEKLPMKNLTSKLLVKYEAWLRSERTVTVRERCRKLHPVSDTGINGYMIAIQAVYTQLKETYNDYETGEILVKGEPFKVYNIPETGPVKKRAISKDDIIKIYNYVPSDESRPDALARDLFIMSFVLAGMNAADMYSCLVFENGRIDYNRQKTRDRKRSCGSAFISVPVNDLIAEIVKRYNDKTGARVFDFYQRYSVLSSLNYTLHKGLTKIGESLDIADLQFYCARHSFATIARNDCGVSMDDIAFCLTHSSGHNITDTYIKPDFSRVDEVIRKVVGHVFG